jgi:hypothetical protein
MNNLDHLAYQLDPALWIEHKLNIVPHEWQKQLLRARRGASIIALTGRQVGKSTAAAWAIAHTMLFSPGSLSVIACPAQRQSGEAVRRVKETLLRLGIKLKVENTYGLELENGSRVLALPGSDDSIRGLTVDGWIVADEAARLSADLIAALRPMRARRPEARFVMLSTAWSRTDPFWTVWASDDPSWLRLKATADVIDIYSQEFLDHERRQLGETAFNREYLGIPGGASVSPFDWELYQRAAQVPVPQVAVRSGLGPPIQPAGPAPQPSQPYRPMRFDPDNVRSWRYFLPPIIAHDVGRSRDRSTAVVGGRCPEGPLRTGIGAAVELPQNISGTARAGALAAIDREHGGNSLIVADLSNDETYGEVLVETFGERVIGLHITRFGDGMNRELRAYPRGRLWVYTIGRTYLFELLHRELLSDAVRLSDTPEIRLAYEQLSLLNVEYRESGTVYACAPGQHDDLGISLAMLVWAARHPDLDLWRRARENALRPRRPPRPRFNWAAVT